ncbi:MAG: hypothetical protein JSU94_13290 [Phycisphaerales bacterium]|nr:MAG: hypothetical protein JSU94_13290 [Phycisphaerales bacterium]
MIFVDYPGHLVALLLAAFFAAITALAFRSAQRAKPSLKRRILLLAAIQYLAVLTLLLILWNPSRPREMQMLSRNSVLVAFDTSESMSLVEDGKTTRLDKAIAAFKDKLSPGDRRAPDYKIFGFDREAYHSGSTDFLRRWGGRTDMHGLSALLARYSSSALSEPSTEKQNTNPGAPDNPGANPPAKKHRIAGAVIFTDGGADDKNVSAYAPTPGDAFPIVFVGVGSKQPHCDVAVKSLSAPSRVAVDTPYQANVAVTAANLQGRPVSIELLRDDSVIDSRRIAAETFAAKNPKRPYGQPADDDLTIEFTLAADRLGTHTILARAKVAEDEINSANNTRSATVEVVEENRLKVLLYSQRADFNIGKVRQALARDSRIRLDLGLDVIRRRALSREAFETLGYVRLPRDRADFYEYDIIVLGPCEPGGLTDVQIDGLYSFVADRGGGLVLLPGPADAGPAAWLDEKAKTLMPAILDRRKPLLLPPSPGSIELTPEGLDSKVLGPADLKDLDQPAAAHYRIIQTKPAATTLAAINDAPLIALHRVGRGRVCLLNASRLFNWYREDLEGGLLYKVLAGLTGHLGSLTSRASTIELFAERPQDRKSAVRFDAYVCDRSFRPAPGANVLLNLQDLVVSMDDLGRGYYVTQIDCPADRAIVATVQAELDGVFLGEKSIAVNLSDAPTEMAEARMDQEFLLALAKRLNGKYSHAEDIDRNFANMFEAQAKMGTSTRMASAWPTWPLLLALSLLLSIGWFLRRNIGLA